MLPVTPKWVQVFTQVTAGSSQGFDLSAGYQHLTVFVTGYGTISTGTLIVEESDQQGFGGTWSQIDSIDLTAVTGGSTTGIQQASHEPVSAPGTFAYRWVRLRIGTSVTGSGGSVSVSLLVSP